MPRFGRSLDLLLVGSAIVAGWWLYGWKGLILALTVIVFWLVLQFNRANRVLRRAGERPVGHLTESVVMLQSQLSTGMTMAEVLALTGSLGKKLGQRDDWQWMDAGGDELVVSLRRGVVVRWAVARADTGEAPAEQTPDSGPDDIDSRPRRGSPPADKDIKGPRGPLFLSSRASRASAVAQPKWQM